MGGLPARVRDKRNANRVLVGKPEGRKYFEEPDVRWEDIIKIDLN
jgi:hypothetical protein